MGALVARSTAKGSRGLFHGRSISERDQGVEYRLLMKREGACVAV
jgi:hypothetical protein